MNPLQPSAGSNFLYILGFITLLLIAAFITGPSLGTTRPTMGTLKKEGALILTAIEKYRHDHGVLPINLEALVPRYLPELTEVTYCYTKSYTWPHKLFDKLWKSDWAYKTNHDRKSYALGVKASTRMYYDSQTGEWSFGDDASFVNYAKPHAAVKSSMP